MAQITPIQRIFGRIREFFSTSSNEVIMRVRSYTRRWRSSFRQPTNDWGRPDYLFWRRAYYGRAAGLEVSGLLIKPIVSKLAAWTLGRAPRWKLDSETSQQALADWWQDEHATVLKAWRAALKQGDAFVVVNSDLTLTLLPPDCVDPIVSDDDYANVMGWRVTQVLSHPETSQRMTVVDEYYPERRIHRIEINGIRTQEITYPNLLGRMTLVHIANQPDSGETFGHAEAEGLLPMLHRYGEVFDAAIAGNIRQGRPTAVLTFDTIADLEKFDDENADFETQTLPNGNSQRNKIYNVDLDELLVTSGATFDYKSPAPFTEDTAQLLELMFYLYGQHSEIPEFILGMAVASSKASTESQMPAFVEFIKMRRGEMVRWLTEIAEIAMGYLALITPGVNAQTPTLQWEPLDQEDGTLTLETLKWALEVGLIDDLTALKLMPTEVDDPEGVLARAKAERAEREVQAMQRMEAQTALAATNAPTPTPAEPPVNEMNGNGHVEKGQALAILEAATVEWMRELA